MSRWVRWVIGFAVTALPICASQSLAAQARADTAAQRAASDSVRRAALAKASADSIRNAIAQARVDSIVKFRAGDTIKSPIAHFEAPDNIEVTERLHLTRAQILTSGAINLVDLLDRVSGVTSFRTGWLAGIHTAAFNGDTRRVRVFYDGVERDAIEARNGGVLDFDDVSIWTLEDIIVERVAGEVRVWLRSFSTRRTTPYTRVDIFTGDLNTNGFRAHFARRFANGFNLQFLGQQLATQSGRVSAFTTAGTATGRGDGSHQFVELRLGWSRDKWTFDVVGTANTRDREVKTARLDSFPNIPPYNGSRREGYLRAAYGDTARGWYAQGLLSAVRTRLNGIAAATTVADTTDSTKVSSDTVRAQTQHVVTAGYRAAMWHVSLTDRLRPVSGMFFHAPMLRAELGGERLHIAAVAEQRGLDSLTEIDVSGVLKPRPWLALVASESQRSYSSGASQPSFATSRAEVALNFLGRWIGGGIIQQGTTVVRSPVLFNLPEQLLSVAAANGVLGSLHGPLYKSIRIDMEALHWNTPQYNRPLTNVRTDFTLQTSWLDRFPKGQFTITTRITHDYRSAVPFFWLKNGVETTRIAAAANVLSALLEIRIQSATVFYSYRNLSGQTYEQIPGALMPASVQMYGLRWDFWN